MRVWSLAVLAGVLAGCGPHRGLRLDWTVEARIASGEIRVMPPVEAFDLPVLRLDGYVAERVTYEREKLRAQRMRELARVPEAVGMAFPGAVHSILRGQLDGQFLVGHFNGGRDRLEAQLRRHDDVDAILADIARGQQGDAVLFTWITDLVADPITSMALPGEVVDTRAGPIVVDLLEEPYRIRADVGMALVSTDGEVVLRYTDEFEALLSGSHDVAQTGRDLAMGLAREVVKVWPVDPRLGIDRVARPGRRSLMTGVADLDL